MFKLNRVNIVKLSWEIRVNLGQNIAYGLTLSNKRKVNIIKLSWEIRINLGQNIAYGLTLNNKRCL